MKKLFPIAIVCLFALSTQAQNTTPAADPSSKSSPASPLDAAPKQDPAQQAPVPAPVPIEQASQATPVSSQDGLFMSGNKMWVAKKGMTTVMTHEMTLENGTKVMADGSYITKDGKKLMLKNGEIIGKDGKVGKVKLDTKASDSKEAAPKAPPAK